MYSYSSGLFVFPEFLPDSLSAGSGDVVAGGWWKNILNHHPAVIGVFALGLYTAARVSEHVRAGINTVSRGQKFAASAMGFTTAQSYRYVILPVAYRTVWPTITSRSNECLQELCCSICIKCFELLCLHQNHARRNFSGHYHSYSVYAGLFNHYLHH